MLSSPEPRPARPRRFRWLNLGAGSLLTIGGLLAMVAGGGALVAGDVAARNWSETDEASQAARQVAAPTPRWIEPGAGVATRTATSDPRPAAVAPPTRPPGSTHTPSPTPGGPAQLAVSSAQAGSAAGLPNLQAPAAPGDAALEARARNAGATDTSVPATPAESNDGPDAEAAGAPADEPPPDAIVVEEVRRAPPSAIEIVGSEFRFLDPPEPGAQAIVALQVRNDSELETGPLRLTLSTRWLTGWRILDADPPVLADRVRTGNRRTFDFPGLDPESERTFELHLVATDDAVDPPELRLSLATDENAEPAQPTESSPEIGVATPETVAPRPRPGPARAVSIPRLGLRAAVVPTAWEPPAFVVGQVRASANLSEGNTVLIGHLNGVAGNVFARLTELEPGDEVIATSRGLEYRYIVSETMTLPGDDSIPIQPTDDARLTLMTCIGDWDPIHLDYSHRLWVVAEPEEIAQTTLAGETPGPLTRLLGLAPELTLLPPDDPGPPPKVAIVEEAPESEVEAQPPAPTIKIAAPADGSLVPSRVVVRGHRMEEADPREPLWLAVRAEIEGSRWYLSGAPLPVRPDGSWEASLEIGGQPGIQHTIVVAPVDPATDTRLKRQVTQRPGEPLAVLPDAFESGARITVRRR